MSIRTSDETKDLLHKIKANAHGWSEDQLVRLALNLLSKQTNVGNDLPDRRKNSK